MYIFIHMSTWTVPGVAPRTAEESFRSTRRGSTYYRRSLYYTSAGFTTNQRTFLHASSLYYASARFTTRQLASPQARSLDHTICELNRFASFRSTSRGSTYNPTPGHFTGVPRP